MSKTCKSRFSTSFFIIFECKRKLSMRLFKYYCIFMVAACLWVGACTKDNPVLTNPPASQEGRQPPHAPVTGIALDAKDLAWIGMEAALITFDGNNTRTFYAGEGGKAFLPTSSIVCSRIGTPLYGSARQRACAPISVTDGSRYIRTVMVTLFRSTQSNRPATGSWSSSQGQPSICLRRMNPFRKSLPCISRKGYPSG